MYQGKMPKPVKSQIGSALHLSHECGSSCSALHLGSVEDSISTRKPPNEEELAVGAVIVMLSDKSDDHSAAAYRLSTRDSSHGDSKLISTATTQKEQSFVAVLAPNCDAAMASLLTQPPGTFLLVKEEDSAIAVYVKFRQAVRALTLVKSKDVKKNDNAIHLAKLRKKELDVTPVQAVVFELCCESHLDEETRLEDWTSSMIPQPAYSVGLMPEACGFYILSVPGNGADSSSVVQVRQVEFDFNKFALTVADGTHKPSALLLATSFSAKRTYEPDFTFGAIRDNFLTPDLVILKETSVNTIPSQQSSLQNCIDLSTNDKELAVLNAADAACCSIMPHEPLPDSLLAVLHEMHICFVNTAVRDGTIPSSKPAHWSTQKKKLVGRIIPILLELLISSATSSEADHVDVHKKRQTLAQFARAVRFDILFMISRSDDSVICRLVHQLCQVFGARVRIPAELIDFIRDLVALFPVFLRLFLRNQGISLLWRNLRHNDVDKDAASGPDFRVKSNSRSFRAFTSSTTVANALQGKGDRKRSVFRLARNPQTKSRKSLSLGTNLTSTPVLRSKSLAFFRLSPVSVQIYLGMHLQEGFFASPDVWKEDPVLSKIAFCSCLGRCEATTACARKRVGSSPKMIMLELLLQLSIRFLYHKTSFASWDRDVALLLRLEEIHRQLFDEIISIVRRRSEVQDINTREALACELRVAITCVSTLFRLERKRRQEISSAVGDKKYLTFIYLFRTKIRELNERLQLDATCDDQIGESEMEDTAKYRKLTQFSECLGRAIISLLSFILAPHSLSINGGRDADCIQVNVLNFLSAFVNLDIALPVQTDWESKNSKPSGEDSMNEDAEVIEQLKGELLIRLIGPRMTLEEEQNDQTLWDFVLELMFPKNSVVNYDGTSCMISMAVSFRSLSVPPNLLTTISREYFQLKVAFLSLQQALYTAQDVSLPIDYVHCVASHWRRIEQYCDRIIENEGQEELSMVRRIVELNFRCLVVLASRRSQFPAIQGALSHNRVLSCVLQRLQRVRPSLDEVTSRSQGDNSGSLGSNSIPCLPPLKLPRQLSADSSDVSGLQPGMAKLSLSSPQSRREEVNIDENFILLEPGLHVLAIALVVTYIIIDPNLEIDERLCPRISVSDQVEDSNRPNELLWKLQQHLAAVDMDQRYFEALMVEMKTLQAFSEFVAVKIVEHQRRAGELCAVSGLYNEVSILSKLRGDLAATQLVDFGNYHQEQNFEIVMEYCTCSLTEWRETIKRAGAQVSFRSCLILILRAFEEACHCLTRIHKADDWAGLYAHLVVTQDQHVLRSDHKQKMVTALNPTTSDEEAVVMNLLELCCNILVREPTRRPKLEMIVAQVCNLINDVYALPLTTSDESFTSLCQLNTENLVPEAVPEFRPFTTAPSCRKRVETHGVIVPVRLFWNFFLAAEVTKTQDTQKVASCVGHGENIMAIDVFESKYEDNFVHFVYLSWHESGDSNVHKVSQFFEEIHEEKHRTCFLLNAQLSTDLHLFQQHAAQHFPVIQRRLRDEAGCVVFVALGKDEEDSKTLQGILTNILCFFFRSVVNMSVFDILSCFARECAQFFEYPKPEFLKQLMAYSNTRAEDTETSTMVQCRCGAIVFSVEAAVVAEALTKHSFKPFDETWMTSILWTPCLSTITQRRSCTATGDSRKCNTMGGTRHGLRYPRKYTTYHHE
ncbi:Protein kinase-like domain [Phytophthora cactorum]|nr:Protein kinase-like domain [Phytophthora cactorum]